LAREVFVFFHQNRFVDLRDFQTLDTPIFQWLANDEIALI